MPAITPEMWINGDFATLSDPARELTDKMTDGTDHSTWHLKPGTPEGHKILICWLVWMSLILRAEAFSFIF